MKRKLVFVNEVPNQFQHHQDYIKKIITYFFNELDLDIQLKIVFEPKHKENEFEETDCFLKNKSAKNIEMVICDVCLSTIDHDGGLFFYFAMLHEFEHIYDYVRTMQTKLLDFNPCLRFHKSLERTFISVGFNFWTEIDAYYYTFEEEREKKFPERFPFSNLVNAYKKTIELDKKLYYKQDITVEEGTRYINTVDSFIYLCAKCIASISVGITNFPYKKISTDKNYKKVYSILCGLEPKVQRIINDPYGQKTDINLLKLGKYICNDIKLKIFKVGLIKHRGKYTTIY